ncbi:MAG TPA: GtrA family protein [Actinoplanes sp.]|nr:GtrA family protein [Actinoplanes sp.]
MPSAHLLTERLRRLAPEALAFGTIGAANTLLYMVIVWVALPIGAVKASVLATVVTTTLAYFANRYWTYRHHSRSALRREYTLFFGFNLAGMVIQSGAVAIGKYGAGLTETEDKHLLLGVTVLGIGLATVFRFWAYRTFVFLKPGPVEVPATAAQRPVELAATTAQRPVDVAAPQPRAGTDDELPPLDLAAEIEAELNADLDTAERPAAR